MAIEVNEVDFDDKVLKSDTVVLVDFFAPWCGPCRSQAPILDALTKETDKVKVVKVNVDDNGSLAQRYGVMSIPTLIVFKDGKPNKKAVGLQSLSNLKTLVGLK